MPSTNTTRLLPSGVFEGVFWLEGLAGLGVEGRVLGGGGLVGAGRAAAGVGEAVGPAACGEKGRGEGKEWKEGRGREQERGERGGGTGVIRKS